MTDTVATKTPICTRFQQTVTIKNFLSEDYYPFIGKTIFLTIGDVTNPTSTYQVDGLKITIAA
jgi:hypothetical protein